MLAFLVRESFLLGSRAVLWGQQARRSAGPAATIGHSVAGRHNVFWLATYRQIYEAQLLSE